MAGLVGAASLAGCTKFDELAPEPAAGETGQTALTAEEVRAEALWAAAVWDEQTQQWLRPQNDPYKLENFQRAYDNLVAGRHQIPTSQELAVAREEAARAAKTSGSRANAASSKDAVAAVQTPEGAVWAEVTEAVAKEFARKASAPKKLQATHRAVKIWPKTEEEQDALERDEELDVRYYPIEYVAVVGEDAEMLSTRAGGFSASDVGDRKMSGGKALPNETRYTVVEEGGMTTEGPAEPRTITMPTLYVVWPVGKSYPAGMDYEEQYEIFLPNATTVSTDVDVMPETNLGKAAEIENGLVTAVPKKSAGAGTGTNLTAAALTLNLSADALQALEFEAIEIALRGEEEELGGSGLTAETGDASAEYGSHFVPKGGGWAPDGQYNPVTGEFDLPVGGGGAGGLDDDWRWTYTTKPASMKVSGKVMHEDNYLAYTNSTKKFVPLANLQVLFTLGSNIVGRDITSEDGSFSSKGALISSDAQIKFIFTHSYWLIRHLSNESLVIAPQGTVWENYQSNRFQLRPSESSYPLYETHRAVNYYFHGDHSIPPAYEDLPGIIYVSPKEKRSYFHHNYLRNTWIVIYRRSSHNHAQRIGAILHELGHWSHWCMRGGKFSTFDGTWRIIKESWASYVGWELGERYYCELQDTGRPSSSAYSLTGYDQQDWYSDVNVSDNLYYSPLFVDLVDDHDEWASYGIPFARDGIQEVPYEVLNRLGREARTYEDFRRIFSEYYWSWVHAPANDRIKEMKLMEYFYVWDALASRF